MGKQKDSYSWLPWMLCTCLNPQGCFNVLFYFTHSCLKCYSFRIESNFHELIVERCWKVCACMHVPAKKALSCPSRGTINMTINANKNKMLSFCWRLITEKTSVKTVIIGPSWVFYAIVQAHQGNTLICTFGAFER